MPQDPKPTEDNKFENLGEALFRWYMEQKRVELINIQLSNSRARLIEAFEANGAVPVVIVNRGIAYLVQPDGAGFLTVTEFPWAITDDLSPPDNEIN